MKKFNLWIALALFAGTVAISPTVANAQDAAAQQAEFERGWYEACYTKKEMDKCYTLSKELLEKYPSSTYGKNATSIIKNRDQANAWEKFNKALTVYYAPPQDSGKLEALFTAGEDFYKFVPDEPYVAAQLALAGSNGVLGPVQYKNLDKVKSYAEKAMKIFEGATPVKGYEEQWKPLRELIIPQMNQYMGYYLVETKGDQDKALQYLTTAISVKGKEGVGAKDPNNYLLRAGIYSKKYEDLRKQYDQLPDDQKTGDAGKELLKQVNQLLDTKLIPEYARVLATSTRQEYKPLYDSTKPLFDSFWKYRTDAPDKAAGYLKAFEADPTVQGPEIPAKAEDTSLNAPAAPVTGPGVKPMAGAASMAPGGKAADNGAKAAPGTKGNAKKAKGKRRR
jgi:hypothetical protein